MGRFEQLMTIAEGQLCMHYDTVSATGIFDPRYVGRGRSQRYVFRPAVPRGVCAQGRLDAHSLGLWWLRLRLLDLLGFLRLARRGRLLDDRRCKWMHILRQIGAPTGVHLKLVQGSEVWRHRTYAVGLLTWDSVHCIALLAKWAGEANEEMVQRTEHLSKAIDG